MAGVLNENAANRVPIRLETVAARLIPTEYCPVAERHCRAVADCQLVVPHDDEPICSDALLSIPPNPKPVIVKLALPDFGAFKGFRVITGAS